MAQKYYNSAETAKILGKSVDDVKKMLERRELHGYRDGADWKFKVEDIDRLAKSSPPKPAAEEEGGDVLLSEVALGQSDPGLSGTVIGMSGVSPIVTDSDIRLAESDIQLGEQAKTPIPKKKGDSDAKGTKFEELNLSLEDDLTLEDSAAIAGHPAAGGSSAVELGGKEESDDELVLAGSSTGSDVTIGGDSGISLVDPSDSGLSLETPINLGAVSDGSLKLADSDLAPGSEVAAEGTLSAIKADDDFLLTPLEEVGRHGGFGKRLAGDRPGGRGRGAVRDRRRQRRLDGRHARRRPQRAADAGLGRGRPPGRFSGVGRSAGGAGRRRPAGPNLRGFPGILLHGLADHRAGGLHVRVDVLRHDDVRPAAEHLELARGLPGQQRADGYHPRLARNVSSRHTPCAVHRQRAHETFWPGFAARPKGAPPPPLRILARSDTIPGMYETFEHTADVGIRARAGSLDELFAEAAKGLFFVMLANPEAVRAVEEVTFASLGRRRRRTPPRLAGRVALHVLRPAARAGGVSGAGG